MKRRHMLQCLASKRRKLTKDLVNRTKTGKIAFFMFFSRKKKTGRTDRFLNNKKMPKIYKVNANWNRINWYTKRKIKSSKSYVKIEEYIEENPDRAKYIKKEIDNTKVDSPSAPLQILSDHNQKLHQVDMDMINTQFKATNALIDKVVELFEQSKKDIAEIKTQTSKIEQIEEKLNNLKPQKGTKTRKQSKKETETETGENIPEIKEFKELLDSVAKQVQEMKAKDKTFEETHAELKKIVESLKTSSDSVLEALKILPTKNEITELTDAITNYNSEIKTAQAAIKESIDKLPNINEEVKNTLNDFNENFVKNAIAEFKKGAEDLTNNFKTIAEGACAKFGEFNQSAVAERLEELNKLKKEYTDLINELKKKKETNPEMLKSNEEYVENINTAISQIKTKLDNIDLNIPIEPLKQYIRTIAVALYNDLSKNILTKQTQKLELILKRTKIISQRTLIIRTIRKYMETVVSSMGNLATEASVEEVVNKLATTNLGVESSSQELAKILENVNVVQTILGLLRGDIYKTTEDINRNILHASDKSNQNTQLLIEMIQNHSYFNLQSLEYLYTTLSREFKRDINEINLITSYRFEYLNYNIQQITSQFQSQHREVTELLREVKGSVYYVGLEIEKHIYNGVDFLHYSVQSSTMMVSQQIFQNRNLIHHMSVVIQDNLDYLLNNFIESQKELSHDVIKATEQSFFHYYLQVGHNISQIRDSVQQQNQDVKDYINKAADSVNNMLENLGIYTDELRQELINIRNIKIEGSVIKVALTMPEWYTFLFPLRKYTKSRYLKREHDPEYHVLQPLNLDEPIGEIMEIPDPSYEYAYLSRVVPHSDILEPQDPTLKSIAVDNTAYTTVVFDAVEHVATSMFGDLLKIEEYDTNRIVLLNPYNVRLIGGTIVYPPDLDYVERVFKNNEFVRNMASTLRYYLKELPDIPNKVAEKRLKLALGERRPNFYTVYNGEIVHIDYPTAGRLIFHLGVVINGIRNVFRRKHSFDKKYPDRIHQLPVMLQISHTVGVNQNKDLSLQEVGGANMERYFYDRENYYYESNRYMAYSICILACMTAFVSHGVMHHVFKIIRVKRLNVWEQEFAAVMRKAAGENDGNIIEIVEKFTEKTFISMDIIQYITKTREGGSYEYQLDITNEYLGGIEDNTAGLIGPTRNI